MSNILAPIVPIGASRSYAEARAYAPSRSLIIAGSTGSVGVSTLELVRAFPSTFRVIGLTANRNAAKLGEQAREFQPKQLVLCSVDDRGQSNISNQCEYGEAAICSCCSNEEADTVVMAIVGVAALKPTLEAINSGKKVALANKESIVCGAEFVRAAVSKPGAGTLIPVDSEHSAIFQLLAGKDLSDVRSVTLTASGGPFLRRSLNEIKNVTVAEAISHPRWKMGAKISVDSATLMNKALEVIEAHELFGLPEEKINVIVHPESIIHSIVTLNDGSQLLHASVADMKGPIGYALSWPGPRMNTVVSELDLPSKGSLAFERLDEDRFCAIRLARAAIKSGTAAKAAFCIANEIAVERFLSGLLSFDKILPFVEDGLERFCSRKVCTIGDLYSLEKEVRDLGWL